MLQAWQANHQTQELKKQNKLHPREQFNLRQP